MDTITDLLKITGRHDKHCGSQRTDTIILKIFGYGCINQKWETW